MIRIFNIFMFSLAVTLLSGCAADRSQWVDASRKNTIKGYQSFIKAHPDSRYVSLAENNINKINEDKAQKERISENWKKLKNGMFVTKVDKLIGPLGDDVVKSIRNNSLLAALAPGSISGSTTFRGDFFTLTFNVKGGLVEWSLK